MNKLDKNSGNGIMIAAFTFIIVVSILLIYFQKC